MVGLQKFLPDPETCSLRWFPNEKGSYAITNLFISVIASDQKELSSTVAEKFPDHTDNGLNHYKLLNPIILALVRVKARL